MDGVVEEDRGNEPVTIGFPQAGLGPQDRSEDDLENQFEAVKQVVSRWCN